MRVAALYVDQRGPYPAMRGVDAWDKSRDATRYEGPHPVVAHPPCAPWSASLSGLHEREGERPCAVRAVEQVRRWGGVLEHPAHSRLWMALLELPYPNRSTASCPEGLDRFGGFTIEVCQVDFGHVARKRTWLYFVGVPRAAVDAACPVVHREPTHWCSGGHRAKRPPPPGVKVASAYQRNRTPVAFAQWLVDLARMVHAPLCSEVCR